MDYYFENVGLPLPDFGFSPDAEFPIINGEKGNITAYLHFAGKIAELLNCIPSQAACVRTWCLNLRQLLSLAT